MRYLVTIICLLLAAATYAQTDTTKDEHGVYKFVQDRPEAKYSMSSYLSENLHYPIEAKEKGIEGRVIVRFIINEDGKVSDATILKGIGSGCDEEAKRVVMDMPLWKPGMKDGKPVKVYFTLPIQFRLE